MRRIKRLTIKRIFVIPLIAMTVLIISGCSGSSSSDSSSAVGDALNAFLGDSANVSSVKDASISSCPSATLGEMADAFMSNPSWRDFDSTSGGTVVELSGEISYGGAPASAVIQFDLTGDSFQAVYLGIDNEDQSMLMLSSLLTKMCNATF